MKFFGGGPVSLSAIVGTLIAAFAYHAVHHAVGMWIACMLAVVMAGLADDLIEGGKQ